MDCWSTSQWLLVRKIAASEAFIPEDKNSKSIGLLSNRPQKKVSWDISLTLRTAGRQGCLIDPGGVRGRQAAKLRRARSWLYRRRFLQVNTKYSLESSWRDLQDLHTFAPLRSQNFTQKSSTFFREWRMNFRCYSSFLCRNLHFFCEFFMKFRPDFATNSRKEWCVSFFQSNLRKQIRNLPKILKSVKIIHYY